jgi:hypothetical protein
VRPNKFFEDIFRANKEIYEVLYSGPDTLNALMTSKLPQYFDWAKIAHDKYQLTIDLLDQCINQMNSPEEEMTPTNVESLHNVLTAIFFRATEDPTQADLHQNIKTAIYSHYSGVQRNQTDADSTTRSKASWSEYLDGGVKLANEVAELYKNRVLTFNMQLIQNENDPTIQELWQQVQCLLLTPEQKNTLTQLEMPNGEHSKADRKKWEAALLSTPKMLTKADLVCVKRKLSAPDKKLLRIISGLEDRPELNGQEATIVSYNIKKERFIVSTSIDGQKKDVSIVAQNLSLPTFTIKGLQKEGDYNGLEARFQSVRCNGIWEMSILTKKREQKVIQVNPINLVKRAPGVNTFNGRQSSTVTAGPQAMFQPDPLHKGETKTQSSSVTPAAKNG